MRHYLLAAALIVCIDIMPPSQPTSPLSPVPASRQPTPQLGDHLPNAGIPGPIPDDFDFNKFLVIPTAVNSLDIPLASRITMNAEIEKSNNKSITKTVTVRSTATPRPNNMDIGPALDRPYAYSTDELRELVESETLCIALSPLPVGLIRIIAIERSKLKKVMEQEKQAEKEKEKEADPKARSKLLGTMRLDNPIDRVMGKAEEVNIPTVYLLGITNKCCPPLNFFTNERIKIVNHSPQDIHTKLTRPWAAEDGTGEKILLLDYPKMVAMWGSDDNPSCLTPFRFLEASGNFYKALKLLAAPCTDPDSTTYAIEYQKHCEFFAQLDNFEATYPHWYKFELKARREVLQGIHFDWKTYALEIAVILQVRDSLVNSTGVSAKRTTSEFDARVTKFPKQSFHTNAPTSRTANSFRDNGPTCLLCGRGHRYRDHPTNISSFEDGKPLFCRLEGSNLYTTKPFKGPSPKRICTMWNVTRNCDGRHGADCIHSCSLCGSEHSALEQNPACARVRDGKIQA